MRNPSHTPRPSIDPSSPLTASRRRMRPLLAIAAAAVLPVLLPGLAHAQWTQTSKLVASDGVSFDYLGSSADISGNTVVLGTSKEGNTGSDRLGAAYLYNATTGAQRAKLTAPIRQAFSEFAFDVAISGTKVLAGNPFYDYFNPSWQPDTGAVHVFDAVTGAHTAQLTASDFSSYDRFGQSVAASGNLALIGAPGDDYTYSFSGSAYVFDLTTNQQVAKLRITDGNQGFGSTVALSGNTAVVAASTADQSGIVYVMNATTGQQLRTLRPNDIEAGDLFGTSIAVTGNVAVIGSPNDSDKGYLDVPSGFSVTRVYSGGAYLFDITTGQQIAKLSPADHSAGDKLGRSVAISGNIAMVGANTSGSTDIGAAYLFDATTGAELGKVTPADGAAVDYFGSSVGLSGNIAVAGSVNTSVSRGSGYVFTNPNAVTGGTITFAEVAPGVSITLDDLPRIFNTGAPGSVIQVSGFSITGPDAAFFALPGYTNVALTAGAFDAIAYDLQFLGGTRGGNYSAMLTLFTDSGNVNYGIAASVIPEPTSLALLTGVGLLAMRRRR